MNKQPPVTPSVEAVKWLSGNQENSLAKWKSSLKGLPNEETRNFYLVKKYASIWLQKVHPDKGRDVSTMFSMNGWLHLLLFAPSSRATRQIICIILENLAQVRT